MAEYEITFASFAGAVKHHWRLLLLTLVLFSAIGAGASYFYAERGAAELIYHADAARPVSFQDIRPESNYYYVCQDALEKASSDLRAYLDSIASVSTLTEEDRAAISAQRKEIEDFEREQLAPLRKQLNGLDAIYVPERFLPVLIEDYESSLAATERNLISAAAAAEIVKGMAAPSVSDEASLSNYNALLSRAYNYTSYLQDLDAYRTRLERLKSEEDMIRADGREMARQQKAAADALNALGKRTAEFAEELAEKRLLNITVQYSADNALTVTASHTHSAATAQENFQIVWLFCTLSGLCVGAFLALCREAGAFPRKKQHKGA